MRVSNVQTLFLMALACLLANFGTAESTGEQVLVTYETVVETYHGEKLVDTYSLRGSKEVPVEYVFDEETGEFYENDAEMHLFVTFTRYSDTFLTICVILSIFVLIAFLFTERSEMDEEEQDEDAVEGHSHLTQPLVGKA